MKPIRSLAVSSMFFLLIGLVVRCGPAASDVSALVERLRSDDPDQAETATFALARISPDPAVEPAIPLLTEALQGGKGWVASFNSAVALLKLGREEEKARAILRDEVHLSLMLPLLKDKDPMNRLHVCEALMLSGPPQRDFLDLLRNTAARDSDARVREAALKALRKVDASEHALVSADPSPKALATLPPELAEAGMAFIEFQKTPGMRLLGGVREGSSAKIDYFTWSGTIYSHGTITMVREGNRWVHEGLSFYPASSDPVIDDSTKIGLSEAAALTLLKAIAAAQIRHWHRFSSYADSLAKLDIQDKAPGYVVTLAAGAKSNGAYHAWSAEAHPERYKETGVHSYYADERGVLLQSDTRGLPLTLEMPEH